MGRVLAHRARVAPGSPVHIHVAEQLREVQQCEAWSGRRPVEWLLDNGLPDAHWCLVHATHMTPAETRALAATGAVVGAVPDHRGESRRRPVPAGGVSRGRRAHRHRLRQPRLGEPGGGAALARVRPAAGCTGGATSPRPWRSPTPARAWSGRCSPAARQALGQPAGRDRRRLTAPTSWRSTPTHPLLAGGDGDELLDRFVFAGNGRWCRA